MKILFSCMCFIFFFITSAATTLCLRLQPFPQKHTPVEIRQPIETTNLPSADIEQQLQALTLEEKVGQLFLVGFPEKQLTKKTQEALSHYNFGGVVLFSKHIANEKQLKELTQSISSLSKTMPFIAVDQEGKPVVRVSFDPTANTRQKDISSIDQAYAIARQRGAYLRSLGITMNFSPVVDVSTNKHAGMFARTFTKQWGEFGDAMVRGYKDGGSIPVVKHFPSYGEFVGDVEREIPTKEFSEEEKETFRVALQHADVLMVSPVIIPSIDPNAPAPISAKVMHYIRTELQFSGLILTDDLEMKSIRRHYNNKTFAIDALVAGVDMVMFSSSIEDAVQAREMVLQKIHTGELPMEQVDNSVRNMLRIKTIL